MKTIISPRLLVIDELGYLPADKQGPELLFQVISNPAIGRDFKAVHHFTFGADIVKYASHGIRFT
jgi:DNA replication protein DnaC